MKKVNYKVGALKRKFGIDGSQPGDFISKYNSNKESNFINNNQPLTKKQVAIRGLI